MKIAPSILAADFANLGNDIKSIESADYVHLDVMDGTFVPNISFGFPVIEAVAPLTEVPLDAHLMVVHPERWFKRLAELGVNMVSFHYEATVRSTLRCIEEIHELGMKAGIAINPDVPVEKLYRYIGKADFFLIMSVFAGFGGQKFIYESLDRISALCTEIERLGGNALIEVDGGVSSSNAGALREAGADILVAGSSVFKSSDRAEAIKEIREA